MLFRPRLGYLYQIDLQEALMTDDMNRAGILARFNCLAPPVHAKPVIVSRVVV